MMVWISNLVKTVAVTLLLLGFQEQWTQRVEWINHTAPIKTGMEWGDFGDRGLDTAPFSDPVSKGGGRILFGGTSVAIGCFHGVRTPLGGTRCSRAKTQNNEIGALVT